MAYNTYPEGCILITDGEPHSANISFCKPSNLCTAAMKILDPHLKDGVHEWRDGKRFVKQGVKLFLEGTDTLAGRYVALSLDWSLLSC